MTKRIAFILILASFALTGASCISFSGSGARGSDGGIFKTINAGDVWFQKAAIPTATGQPKSFAGTNVISMAIDPSDRNAITIGTRESGLFYSFDAGETWTSKLSNQKAPVNAIVINPEDKCTIFAALQNRIIKTSDCYRTFTEVYRDPLPDSQITDLAIDFFDTSRVYAATSRGNILKSETGGESWALIKNFGNIITDLTMSPGDSRILYVVTSQQGVWKTADGGSSWVDLTPQIKKIAGIGSFTLDFSKLMIAPSSPNTLVLLISRYGLVLSNDGGDSWSQVKLLTEPGTVTLYSMAIGPKSDKTLYYGTASTFYRTSDGGATWETKRIPTTRLPRIMLVDPEDSKIIYFGSAQPLSQ